MGRGILGTCAPVCVCSVAEWLWQVLRPGCTLGQALVAPGGRLGGDKRWGGDLLGGMLGLWWGGGVSTGVGEHGALVAGVTGQCALRAHSLGTGHTFGCNRIGVVDMEPRRDWRKVAGAIHIRLRSMDIDR